MRRSGNERLFWESLTKGYTFKATALLVIVALVVVGCGREGALSRAIDDLNYDSLPGRAERPAKPADELHAAAAELEGLLAQQGRRSLSTEQVDKAHAARAKLDGQLRAARRRFAADREKLADLDAKAALARLDKIEARTTSLERSLRDALAAVPADGAKAGAPAARAKQLLAQLSPEKPEQPLSSDFGFGAHNAKGQSPELSAGLTPAYSAPTPTETPSDLPRTAEAADLAATPETAVTPAIHALAQQLGGDPVKIYDYVRNTIRFEPYYGIRKGAAQTLAERSGSDADQAALLIALLRDSGVHARFVQGTAQLPAATAANWLGVDTGAGERVDAAPDILASAGIPATQVRANGQLVKVRFAHFWAEAYVPADAYRGAEEHLAGKSWLALDPSIKANDLTRPSDDVKDAMEPIARRFAQGFVDASDFGDSTVAAPDANELAALVSQSDSGLQDLLAQQGVSPSTPASEIVGGSAIRQTNAPYLPSSLPAPALAVGAELRAVPANLRSRVTFTVSGADPLSLPSVDPEDPGSSGFTYTGYTTDLANKRVTLGYAPATAEDAEIIDAYHGLLNAPSYAASLIPVLRVDGHVVARGRTPVSTGYTQTFDITYRQPGYAADTVTNPVYVGSLSAIALDLGSISGSQLTDRAEALQQLSSTVTTANIMTDARGGEMLSQLATLYFLRNDAFNTQLGHASGVHQSRDLSGAITATSVTPRYLGGFPIAVKFDGLTIDVDQDSQVVVPKSASSIDNYMRASGMYASDTESAIFEYAVGWEAVSTMRVLRVAAEQGVPVHRVTGANAEAELARLDLPEAVERRIASAVARPGVEVMAPQREIAFGGWSGVGYVVSAGNSTDYRISGGASGGAAINPFTDINPEGPFGPLVRSVPRSAERVKEANDCDEAKIAALALIALLMALIIILLILVFPASVPLVTVEVLEFGVAMDAPLISIVSTKFFVGGLAGLFAAEEWSKC